MTYDLIFAGAGLANGLMAWRLKQARPDLRLLCIEEQAHLGQNHTWSFHANDLSSEQRAWLSPLIVKAWPAYDVHFPGHSRRMSTGYASITSERFAQVVEKALGDDVRLGQTIVRISPRSVVLENGEALHAGAVIDGRGFQPSAHLVFGRQAFLGQLLRLTAPHGLNAPIIMDARVKQRDGYRFVYVLPFSADTVLVEDTHYVDHVASSSAQLRENIAHYVQQQGWTVASLLREEEGVLPITLAGDYATFAAEGQGQPRSGLRAGLFHCSTGYSLPHAVRLADWLAQQDRFDAQSLACGMQAIAQNTWQEQRFCRLLNRMLFLAGKPQDRWRVMRRFYGLSEGLISRFYAERLSVADKLRILSGKPPVPINEAVRAAVRYLPRHYEKNI